jgi:hypothetical protein
MSYWYGTENPFLSEGYLSVVGKPILIELKDF